MQTLTFSQKPEMVFSKEQCLQLNRAEIEHCKRMLERARTRYIIVDEKEEFGGSIVLHVKKQYNDKADVSKYFKQNDNITHEVHITFP